MKLYSLLRVAVFLSINRFIGQVGTVSVLAMLGHYNTQLLASFTVLSANIAIFFVIATSGAIILQTEFAKLLQKTVEQSQLLIDTLLFFVILSCLLYGFILLINPNYLIFGVGAIFDEARQCLPTLALCIPLHAINAVLAIFIEVHDHAKAVSKIQIGQTVLMVLLVAIALSSDQPRLFAVITAYIASDVLSVIAFVWFINYKKLVRLKCGQLSHHLKRLITPFSISAPSIISQVIMQYSAFALTRAVTILGAASSTTLTTIFSLVFLSQILVVGIGQKISMEIAQQLNNQQLFWSTIKTTSLALLLVGGIFILLLLTMQKGLGQLITDDLMALQIFKQSLGITILFCIACTILTFLGCLLRGIGDYLAPQIILMVPMTGFIIYTFFSHHALSFTHIFHFYLMCLYIAAIGFIIRLIYFYFYRIYPPRTTSEQK